MSTGGLPETLRDAFKIRMLTFSQFVTEIYAEPDDSTFTDNGFEYDLNGLLSATLGMPTQQFSVSALKWIFKWDNPSHDLSRVNAADLNTPILVAREGNQLVTLDGLHRVAKAAAEHRPSITGILVPDEILSRYRINKPIKEACDQHTHFGFIKPTGEIVTGRRDDGRHKPRNHSALAVQHGYEDAGDAQKHGWVRYNHVDEPEHKETSYSFHHSPNTAALVSNHLAKVKPSSKVVIDMRKDGKATSHEFDKYGDARRHLESITESAEDDERQEKGWMSPTGKAHRFSPDYDGEHGHNHHPDIAHAVKTHLKAQGYADGEPDYEDTKGMRASLAAAQKHGYARYGSDGDHHYVHFDHASEGGAQAAIHAIKKMKPRVSANRQIVVTHKPWSHRKPAEHVFRSPSEAIAHVSSLSGK